MLHILERRAVVRAHLAQVLPVLALLQLLLARLESARHCWVIAISILDTHTYTHTHTPHTHTRN
jgi:hypothetical protein